MIWPEKNHYAPWTCETYVKKEIDEARAAIAQYLHGTQHANGFDWAVEFAEVFEVGGFDVVLANPPYGASVDDDVRDLYFDPKTDRGQSKDTYGLFIARALQLLRSGGQFCYIVSDTWRTIKSHKPLRKRLLQTTKIAHVLDLPSWIFTATVNTCILTLSKTKAPETHTMIAGDLRGIHVGDWQTLADNLNAVAVSSQDVQTTEYARYTYPQNLISTYANASFFIASPKLYKLLSDKRFKRLGEIADVKVGLQTGDNEYYIRKRVGARGSYELLDESKLLANDQISQLSENEKRDGVDPTKYSGRSFVPYDKGGEAETGEGWLPNYFVPTQYYINWSRNAVNRLYNATISDIKKRKGITLIPAKDRSTRAAVIRNAEFYFRSGISFSDTGVYAPTFRISAASVFDQKGSVIIPDGSISSQALLGFLCSGLARYIYKTYVNHTVSSHVDSIKEFPCIIGAAQTQEIEEFVRKIIVKQISELSYPYYLL